MGRLAIVVVIGLAACARPQTSAPDSTANAAPSVTVPATASEHTITFNLDDADATDVLKAAANVAEKPVDVAADAQPLVACTRVTIHLGEGVAVSKVVPQVAETLGRHGLVVRDDGHAIRVTKAADARPCP